MKAATAAEIKQTLKETSHGKLVELCLRLARHKKENKELLTYLLFEQDDLSQYIKHVKEEMDEQIAQINTSHLYFAKKTLRKVLRTANKHIRYTGIKTAEADILIHYLTSVKGLKLPLHKSAALTNIYASQYKKAAAAIDSMHEDLQYDYKKELKRLEL